MNLTIERLFTKEGDTRPLERVKWRKTDAIIKEPDGTIMFEQRGVEIPEFWSDRAAQIVASKYFRVVDGKRETSAKQMIDRVVSTICKAAMDQGIFPASPVDQLEIFHDELEFMLVNQLFSFNSPVWFNVGVVAKPQASACFIQHVEDTMESITDLAKKEVMVFKGGSGTGTNLSNLRSRLEKLSGGGNASGPVSFMRGFDAFAGVTKSGGTTRRAAKMVCLNASHPDILEFIKCKAEAEQVARDLYETGKYTAEFNVPGNVYDLVPFQNANNSVRVTDAFMKKVAEKGDWHVYPIHETKEILNGTWLYQADELWDELVKAAHFCGDPGLQFHDTVNRWHTCPKSGPITASNPCSEFMFLDNSACNLGSLNLLRFKAGSRFDTSAFKHACAIAIVAMETLVDASSYPTEEIGANSHRFRPLGLGYTNLGALLMAFGLPYDSDEGRALAADITALMTGAAYHTSAQLAALRGPFEGYAINKEAMLRVLAMHHDAYMHNLELSKLPSTDYRQEAIATLFKASMLGQQYGFRNSQVTLLAPTGTIAFMMDCDTTSGEPALSLITYKKLIGGGTLKMPLNVVEEGLAVLGYKGAPRAAILKHIADTGSLTNAPHITASHAKVFQTALGDDPISVDGHLKMMAVQQPFLSGAISKTVNLPSSATVEDVSKTYWRAWELGLKAIAIYRDGCKLSQPASAKKTEIKGEHKMHKGLGWGERRRLPDTRKGAIHKFTVGGQEGYLFLGKHDDGSLGELFVEISKEGSALSGLLNMACIGVSVGLQYGVPLQTFIDKFKGMKFEPHGFTGDPEIPMVSSLADYIARYLEQHISDPAEVPEEKAELPSKPVEKGSFHGPPCHSCGNLTARAGSCFVCLTCGTTTGCG